MSVRYSIAAVISVFTTLSLAGQFPASGVNPNPEHNPNPNSRLFSPYQLNEKDGEVTVEGKAARLISRALVLLHENGQAILGHTGPRLDGNASTAGLGCSGDPNFSATANCRFHLDHLGDDVPGRVAAPSRPADLEAARLILGVLGKIPNARNDKYLRDALVETSAERSRFFIDKIDCWWSLASDNFKCIIKSDAFRN